MARKSGPNPIYEKKRKIYRVHFSCNGQYKGDYFRDKYEAGLYQNEVNALVRAYKDGVIKCPSKMVLPDFIFDTAWKNFEEKYSQTTSSISTPDIKLSSLIAEYQQSLIFSEKAESIRNTEKIHISHLKRFLKSQHPRDPFIRSVTVVSFEKYKTFRPNDSIIKGNNLK